MTESTEATSDQNNKSPKISQRPRLLSSRIMMLIRRIHLYAGLFLLPWVFLYGITGAMFNHLELFPEVTIESVDESTLDDYQMNHFPAPTEFAEQIVKAIQEKAGDAKITLAENHGAEFTNPLQFELQHPEGKEVVKIDPVSKNAAVITFPKETEVFEPLLKDIQNLQLQPDPHQMAQQSAERILSQYGSEQTGSVKPLGWTKLNFLATVNGEPARITYVLKDGHVEVTRHKGEDGFSFRRFFMRLHTSHGQPPHWNTRFLWSLVIDTMAIAMVTWGLSGILMWWQIKRTRKWGTIVILLSICTAAILYLNMMNFYSTTKM